MYINKLNEFMLKNLPKLSVNILTFKTNKNILLKCINSVDKSIPINIIENSKNFEHSKYFKKIRRNVKIYCTGKNYGFAKGHNYGFSKTSSRYVLICNPDVIFKKNYFKNLIKFLGFKLIFNILGSQYEKKEMYKPAYGLFNKKEINPKLKKDKFGLQRVNWVVGCAMLFDLNRFKNNKIFDENYFMFYEETDLCKRVISEKGIIYSGSELIINHLGEKSSFAVIPKHKIDYIKLRNWHLMWSSFYFSKKHFGFFHSFAIHFYPLIKNFIKYFIFLVFFQKEKSTKHFYRYLGLINSMLGKKSLFRVQIK